MSFALVSYYLPATGHKRKKIKEVSALRSLCTGGCLFVQCGRLGQNTSNAESSQAEVLGGKSGISWVLSAPWDTQS